MLSQHPPHTHKPHFALSTSPSQPRLSTCQNQHMHLSHYNPPPPPPFPQSQYFPQQQGNNMLISNQQPASIRYVQNSNHVPPNFNSTSPSPQMPYLNSRPPTAGPSVPMQVPPPPAFRQQQLPRHAMSPPPLPHPSLRQPSGPQNQPFTVGDLTSSMSSVSLTHLPPFLRSQSVQGLVEYPHLHPHPPFPSSQPGPSSSSNTPALRPPIPPLPPTTRINSFPTISPHPNQVVTSRSHQSTEQQQRQQKQQQHRQQQLALPISDLLTLERAVPDIVNPSASTASRLIWIKDVLLLASREQEQRSIPKGSHSVATSDDVDPEPLVVPPLPVPAFRPSSGPAKLRDERLKKLIKDTALPMLISLAPVSSLSASRKKKGLKGKSKEADKDVSEREENTKDNKESIIDAEEAEDGEDPSGLALYLRACLTASGAFPAHIALSQRNAFREFETAARKGCGKGWYRLGRDYEAFGDKAHARMCFERGAEGGGGGDVGCVYRIGIAQLFGELNFPSLESLSDSNGGGTKQVEQMENAFRMLYRAATLASADFAHPTYVLAILFLYAVLPPHALETLLPPTIFASLKNTLIRIPVIPKEMLGRIVSVNVNGFWDEGVEPRAQMLERMLLSEAHSLLERGAYLRCARASLVLGRAYEFGFSWEGEGMRKEESGSGCYDPVMSVKYYELASCDAGDTLIGAEADLALSKWFLCGSNDGPGRIEKDERRARECAERGARKGLGKAMFAIGYCDEAGIGLPAGKRDLQSAKEWYRMALEAGEEEALSRLSALELESGPTSGSPVISDGAGLDQKHPGFSRSVTIPMTAMPMNVGGVRDGNGFSYSNNVTENGSTFAPSGFDIPRVADSPAPTLASLSRGYMNAGNSPSPGPGLPQQGARFPLPQPQLPLHSRGESLSALPPPPPGRYMSPSPSPRPQVGPGPMMGPGGVRGPQPYQQAPFMQQRQFEDRPRYRLTDPGTGGTGGENRPVGPRASSVPAPVSRRRQSENDAQVGETRPNHTPPTKYATFAEMGIEGKRAGDKECRVM